MKLKFVIATGYAFIAGSNLDRLWELGAWRVGNRLLILNHLGKSTRPDSNNFPDEVERAVELDVYDPDTRNWNFGHPEVKLLFSWVDKVLNLFSEHPEAGETLKERGEKSDPSSIRFWEAHL